MHEAFDYANHQSRIVRHIASLLEVADTKEEEGEEERREAGSNTAISAQKRIAGA